MTLVCFFAYVVFEPASALAENAREEKQLSENINEINSIWSQDGNKYSRLVGELTNERDEAVKRFRREDGAIELISYSSPVHYLKNGEWAAIDNTLKYDEKTGKFVNTANDFIVELGADEPVLNVSYKGETLSIAAIELPGIINSELSAVVAEREKKDDLADEEKDDLLRFPEELSSALAYYTADGKEAGLEYKLSGKSLSEYITIAERPETVPTYVYSFNTTLIPCIEENAVFFENEKGEAIMYFSAPVMTDAKGNESFDFTVNLVANEDGSYTYTLTPDEEWLMSEETAYPVVIDPDINTPYRGTISDTFISGTNPTTNYEYISGIKWDRIKIGGSNRYRSLIKFDSLPTLGVGNVIIYSALELSRYNTSDEYGKEIDAYRVQQPWDETDVTWSSFYADSDAVDTSRVETLTLTTTKNNFNALDITDLVKRWYAGTYTGWYTDRELDEQYSLVLQLYNDTSSTWYTEYRSAEYNATYAISPYFKIVYVNSTGLEGRFSYSDHSVGRAGNGSVNLFSGNLTFTFDDAGINNGTMPISVSHVYNTNDSQDRPDEDFEADIGYGYGWRLNYAQSIKAVSLPNRTETATYYEFIDGDGTRHYYKKQTSTKYVNELDTDSVLTINTTTHELTINDKGDNKLVFACELFDHDKDSSTAQAYRGRLIRVEDANGNKTLIEYRSSTLTDLRISSITEKLSANSTNGQSITFTYGTDPQEEDYDRLNGMTVPNGLNMSYAYTDGCLTGVTAADNLTCSYTYTSGNKLVNAKSIDNYNINYTYDILDRVVSVQEMADTTPGNSLAFDYGWNVTTVTDNQGRDSIYQFNDAGQAVSIRDNEGNAVYAAYKTEAQSTTRLSAVSKMQHTVINVLKNPSFDASASTPWTFSSASRNDTYRHTGKYSAKLNSNGSAVQTVTVESGETYTLSAYFSGASTGKLQVLNGTTVIAESDPVETYGTTGTDWARGAVTFTAPSSSIKVKLVNTSSSTVYVDTVQLEAGETPNRANLITNSDFSDGINSFNSHNFSSNDGTVTTTDTTHPGYLSDSVLKITGDMKQEYLSQTIYVAGKNGDTYSFGGWCASDSVPKGYHYNTTCGDKSLRVSFYNGDTLVNGITAYFGADTTDWQFLSSNAIAAGTYTKIVFSVRFQYSRNTAYFDGLQLYREEFSQGYEYDTDGNLTGYTSLIAQQNDFQYDSNNNLTSATDARHNTTTYTYDSHHNQLTATTPEGVVTTNVYDTNGNVTSTQVGNSTNYIKASTTYDTASALASAVTDARGNSVSYTYDSNTRQQTTITDAKGNESTYTYGDAASMLRLASLASDGTGTVEYGYTSDGKLSSITRDDTVYSFTYDAWGNVVDTMVGNITLSTNAYDQYGRLESVTYGNGFKTRYEYDSLDRTSKIYQGDVNDTELALTYEFIYNGEGDLYELRNYKTNRASFFEYDHAGRCMANREKEFTVTNGVISYGDTVAGYKYEYDPNNNLSKLTCINAYGSWNTTYKYDKDNRPLTTTLNNGKVITVTYDTVGRITKRSIGLGTAYDTNITYVPGADGSKTALVATYQNKNDDAYSYSYDANGNITEITQGSMSFTYEYDAANQLIRENLYYGSGNINNATYTYEYDDWGNILNKRKYAYTVDTLGVVIETVAYGYNDSQWGDRLTSFGGQTITYDAMGNPESYLGKTLSWEGKQLTSVTDGTHSYSYSYNEDGLRLRKVVDGTDTEYYYNGSVLMYMITGSGSTAVQQRFSYDAAGNLVAVVYKVGSGTSYIYYYLRNAQGDVVKMIDSSGNTVVEYTYDSWGKLIAATGSLANTVGANQPFRYRGYVYDEETGWYYLQSRYYDPTTCRFISADVLLSTGQGVIGHNSFAYCGNNPIARTDDEGEFWHIVIGAAIGAVLGFASNVAGQLISGKKIDLASAGISAATGAIVGGLSAAGVPAVAVGIANAVCSGAETVIEQVREKGKVDNWLDVGVQTAVGFVSGYLGQRSYLKSIDGALKPNSKIMKGALRRLHKESAKKAYSYWMKYTGTLQKKATRYIAKDALKSFGKTLVKKSIKRGVKALWDAM